MAAFLDDDVIKQKQLVHMAVEVSWFTHKHDCSQTLNQTRRSDEPHLFPYSRVVVRFVACCG